MRSQSRSRLWGAALLVTSALVLGACGKKTDSSTVKITNGTEIPESTYPSVIWFYFDTDLGGAICTGTFVTDQIVLTAAHCVSQGNVAEDGAVTMSVSLLSKPTGADRPERIADSLEIYRNPAWDEAGQGVNNQDLAVIYFPRGTAPATSEISNTTPTVGDEIVLVGYGNNDNVVNEGAGTKRMGKNVLISQEEGFLVNQGTPLPGDGSGENSTAGMGDSGGPMFQDGNLIGTTSGGSVEDGVSYVLYVDLSTDSSRAFLGQHIPGL
jgi:secreted trypsin-like serine protease